ncbi:MAG: hypothetical protein R3F19_28940 [Verrucomicrobiales bacterium]
MAVSGAATITGASDIAEGAELSSAVGVGWAGAFLREDFRRLRAIWEGYR